MTARVVGAVLLVAVLVAGCGEDEPSTRSDSTSERTSSTQTPASSDEPTASPEPTVPDSEAGDTGCVVGTWLLDVVDFQGQAEAFMKSVGIPIEELEITGQQQLIINANSFLSVTTDLVINASVQGRTFGYREQSSGGGEWSFETPDEIVVDGFSYTVEPEGSGEAPAVPMLNFSAPLTVECSGDRLTIRGADAPLTGNFVRASP